MRFARFVSLVEILKRSNIKINSLEKFAGNFYINMSQTLLSTIELILDRYEDYSKELILDRLDRYEDYSKELSENKNIPVRTDSYEIPIEDFFHENHMEFVRKVFPEAKKVYFSVSFSEEDASGNLGHAAAYRGDQMAEVVDLCGIRIFAGQNRTDALATIYHELTHCAQFVSGSAGYWINNTIHPEESGGNTQFNNKSFGMPHSTRKKFRSRNRKIQEILGESFYEHDLSTEKYVILVQDGRYLIFLSKENPSGYDSDEDQQNRLDVLKLLCVRGGDGEFISKPGNYYNKDSEKRYVIMHELRSIENFTNASTYCQRKFVEIVNGFKDSYIEFKTEYMRGSLYKNIAKVIIYFLTKEFREIYTKGAIRLRTGSSSTIHSEITRLIRDLQKIERKTSNYSDLKVENPEQYERTKDIFSRIMSHILVYKDRNFLLKITEDARFVDFRNQDFANQLKEKLKKSFKPLVDKRISHVVEESKRFAENMFEYVNSEVTGDSSFEESADLYSKMIIDNVTAERRRKQLIERRREEARAKFEQLYGRPDEKKSQWGYQRPGIPVPDADEPNK